jgi:protein glucosyltransferase
MYSILIPDFYLQDRQYAEDLITIEEAVKANPFEQRQDTIKWRGSLSGSEYPNLENYRRFPRYALLMMSLTYPNVIDARLTNYDFGDNEWGAALRERLEQEFGCPAEKLPATGFVPYKYLISLDGVGAAWKRVATILASGSVLLLHHRWKQFFYPGLKPWVHYVPLKYDFSDVIEQYEWLIAHPSQAKRIAENGLQFAREILYPRALETYFAEVVNKCSELYFS